MRKLKNEELNRLTTEEFRNASKTPLIIVLDNVRSLHNIGSVFRTADAFLAEAVYLCGITACPPHKDIQKTALGATESVHWEYFKDGAEAIRKLKDNQYTVLGIEQTEGSISLHRFLPEQGQKYAVVFGHEVQGVDEHLISLLDGCIEIPQYGTKHSLNIAVCARIVCWDLFIKLKV